MEPLTYTWCHGPAGTSHLFAALSHAGVAEVAGHGGRELRQRCLHSILTSGVPQRLRPGFWDNDGRCCGTAGVGDVLLDAAQDSADAARADSCWPPPARWATPWSSGRSATRPARAGGSWSTARTRRCCRRAPSWMQGAAGIAAFLFRLARVLDDGPEAPVVDRPDQWWAVPARLRTVHG